MSSSSAPARADTWPPSDAAQLGLTVAVVEKQKALGGTCLLWGCIPTKALLEHAHALKVVRGAKEWGISFPGQAAKLEPQIDIAQVHVRKDRIVSGLTRGIEFLFKKNKIDWIKGTARVTGNGGVDVYEGDVRTLRATREIIVATGSVPRSVPGIQIDRKRIITSDEAIHLEEVPRSIAIMGSGAVGVEFASIFSRFGSDVTILELLPRLVPIEDEAVSAELEKSFRKQGITSHTGARVTSARASADAVDVEATLADGKTETLRVDYLLVATGRGPVTAGLERRAHRPQPGQGRLHHGRRSVPDQREGRLRDRRRDHARHAGASSARARVVRRRDHRRRAHCRARASARSTTITCPAARTAIRRSAASA